VPSFHSNRKIQAERRRLRRFFGLNFDFLTVCRVQDKEVMRFFARGLITARLLPPVLAGLGYPEAGVWVYGRDRRNSID